jgi:two-component system NtrC family sensor kinase
MAIDILMNIFYANSTNHLALQLSKALLVSLCLTTLSGCEPVDVNMNPKTMAWALLACLVVVIGQFVLIGVLLARHPRLRRLLRHWGLAEPQLAKTRHQLYSEIARHEATEELLRETQEYLQGIINSLPSILIGITTEGYVTHWNAAAEKATGLTADEALGVHIKQIYPTLPVDMTVIERVIETDVPFKREMVQEGQGAQATFTDITVCPLPSRELAGAVILADDVTLRVRLENMMIQNEKMMSLGEMAAGLAHEINNPLAGILNNVQNITRRTSSRLPANEHTAKEVGVNLSQIETYLQKRQILEFVGNIGEAGERAAHIVKNMLEFSRSSNTQYHTPTDPVTLVEQSLELATNTFELRTSQGIELPRIEREYEPDLPLVSCSPSEIQQVILNLLRNAAQAFKMEDYGPPLNPVITIRLSREQQYACIEIQDNGPGMPESVKRHIFEPFFTTKAVGQGTGLGLSVSYFIITEHHHGTIEVDSQPGRGTTFMIKLPVEGSVTTDGSRR